MFVYSVTFVTDFVYYVEPIKEPQKGKKLFTIEINKCRRNILLNHKHDYCIFNVMDEPEVFVEPEGSIL
jgi:hypothetical protein